MADDYTNGNSSYWEERYLKAKKELEEILNGQDHYAIFRNEWYSPKRYACALQQVGLNIIEHMENYKKNHILKGPLTIYDLTKIFDTLISFIDENREATNIDGLLEPLKTKIKTEEYNKLASKICDFVGLSVMIASICLVTFCIATGSAGLIPLAYCGLTFVAPMLACASYYLNKDNDNERIRDYFFKSTTPGSERARKALFILDSDELKESPSTL